MMRKFKLKITDVLAMTLGQIYFTYCVSDEDDDRIPLSSAEDLAAIFDGDDFDL